MKAAILEKLNEPLVIKDVNPPICRTGQVFVKVLVSGICGSQLNEIKGWKGNEKFLPHMLGHEGCGIVQEIGPGVTTVAPGDKVVMHWRLGDGIESEFPSYEMDGKAMSSGKITTLSEYTIVSENRLTTIPNNTPDELGALLGCGLTTALGVIDNEIDLKLGESVLVLGCGGVGLNLLQGAKISGAIATGVDINEEKRKLVEDLGVKYINSSKDVLHYVAGDYDVVIDTTGIPKLIEDSIEYLNDKGRYILVGQFDSNIALNIPNAMQLFGGSGKSIKATQGGNIDPTKDIPRYINLYNSGMLDIDKIITHRFKLSEINEAIETLKSGVAGRIMIRP